MYNTVNQLRMLYIEIFFFFIYEIILLYIHKLFLPNCLIVVKSNMISGQEISFISWRSSTRKIGLVNVFSNPLKNGSWRYKFNNKILLRFTYLGKVVGSE